MYGAKTFEGHEVARFSRVVKSVVWVGSGSVAFWSRGAPVWARKGMAVTEDATIVKILKSIVETDRLRYSNYFFYGKFNYRLN